MLGYCVEGITRKEMKEESGVVEGGEETDLLVCFLQTTYLDHNRVEIRVFVVLLYQSYL
ncbi:hypothetical protein ES702_01563 [subsurface metagenome]